MPTTLPKKKPAAKAKAVPVKRSRESQPGAFEQLVDFMFAYRHLTWGSRLSRNDFLFNRGRVAISMLLYLLFGMLVTMIGVMMLSSVFGPLQPHSGRTVAFFITAILFGILVNIPLIYLGIMNIKLAILRIHDFGFSGWWLLAVMVAAAIYACIVDVFLPGFSLFLPLGMFFELVLLLCVASPKANTYGKPEQNSVVTNHPWVSAVPFVMLAISWLGSICAAFKYPHLFN